VLTYAPGTVNVEEATRIRITGGETVSDIDIDVPATLEMVRFTVKATLEDGRSVQNARMDVVTTTDDTRDFGPTNVEGLISFVVARGKTLTVRGVPFEGQCASPIGIGPRTYPEVVALVYSRSACQNR
jgi:hypothetical protein